MMRLIVGLFLLLLGSGGAFAQPVPPTGCTTTTCTGAALPSGYLSVVGNQLQNSPGNNVRPACTVFRGLETDSMAAIRNAGFNCVEIGWRDAYYTASGGTPTAANFDDEFSTAPWMSHTPWQSGDMWAYGTSWAPDGLSEGPSWWGNAIDTPTTPALVSLSSGKLNLALVANSGGLSGVGTCNGGTCGTVGTIIQNQQLPGGNQQLFGYYEFSVAVQSIPGFFFQWDVEDYPINSSWTMEIDTNIWTGSDGSKHIRFRNPVSDVVWYETTSVDITQQNIIGVDWQHDFITFYINNVQVAQVANPGGDFQSQAGFTYFLTSDASYQPGLPSVNTGSLPGIASIDYYRIYTSKPSAVAPTPGCNSSTQIASCVANAKAAGLGVIFSHLGNEIPSAGSACVGRQQNGLWFDSGGSSGNDDGCGDGHNWTYAGFKANTVSLLQQFANNQTVIGYEFHNEPLVNGVFTGTGGTSPTGSFNADTSGHIIGPDGNVYHALGPVVEDTTLGDATVSNMQRLFPKVNTIRLAVGAICDFPGGSFCTGNSPSTLESWIRTMTDKHIVVMVESHTCNGQNAQAGDIDQTGEYNWYNTLSNDMKNDTNTAYVWFESANECGHQGITAENRNVYNAVRNCPQGALSCDWLPSTGYSSGAVVFNKGNTYTAAGNCTSGTTGPTGTSNTSDGGCSWNFRSQGNPTMVGFEVNLKTDGNPDGPASQYNSMSNVMWTPHAYNTNIGATTNQNTANQAIANEVSVDQSYTTEMGGGTFPVLYSEVGFIDYANVCGGPQDTTIVNRNPYDCGTGEVVEAALSPTATGAVGGLIWVWHFDSCCEWQTDLVDRNANPLTTFSPFGPIFQTLIANNSPGPVSGSGGGGTPANPPVNWGGGGDTDIRAACSDVGAAVNAVNAGVIEFCPGPLNNTATLLNGTARP